MSTNFSQFIGRIAMKGAFVSLLGAMVVSCSGCGGGGDGAGSPTTTEQAAAHTVLIEAYGDSTVRGCTAQPGAQASPDCPVAGYAVTPHNDPATLQYLLQQRYGAAVTVQNLGIAGTTLNDLLTGSNGVAMPWPQRMAQSKAQFITVKFGINDAYSAGMTAALFANELESAISIARSAGKTIILETPNPIKTDHADLLASLAVATIEVASKTNTPVVDNYGHFSSMQNWEDYLSDGTMHPTAAGYEIQGQNSFVTISQLIQTTLQK
ncbi:SGNH/GDSL hydrolase family protein [Burkholderia pseudomallei]|uniref:SGNH/GDSL hydrolase family protein n=1 Tax=Burkholderia pseudomallei TaxID=28450 RepID=UPI000A1C8BBE|nr:SGNH/GDSL hydrolase family protein [Burkholderia pseudomallei]